MNYRYDTTLGKILTISLVILPIVILILVVLLIDKYFFTVYSEESSYYEEDEEVEKIEPKSNIKIVNLESNTRPYAIMINCHSGALPQAGLQDAYMVYEIMVEYGITRMMALYKDVDINKVGSIRSLRNQYISYAFENDAVIVHAGGSQEALNRVSNEKIDDVDVDGIYGARDKELAKKRAWEHTLFTNSSLLTKGMTERKIRSTTDTKPLLTYSENEIDLSNYNVTKADKISIKYSNYRTSNYQYDANKKVYLRSMNNTKNTDLVTGKQYEVKNIIAYAVKYTTYTDHGYSGYQKLNNIGTGEGYYMTNGIAIPITWTKDNEKSRTIYKIKETGEELTVNDGNTYIQIYPSNGGKLTIS